MRRWRGRRRVAAAVALTLIAATALLAGLALSTPRGERPLRCHHPWRRVRCAVVSGRVLHVSTHDADGDGDMHLVLASRDSATAPLVSVVKIAFWRRPARSPGLLTWVSARGYVGPGAHGESELHAVTVHIDD